MKGTEYQLGLGGLGGVAESSGQSHSVAQLQIQEQFRTQRQLRHAQDNSMGVPVYLPSKPLSLRGQLQQETDEWLRGV